MATRNTYTEIEGIWQCNDCGAYADVKDEITHYDSCTPGDCDKWECNMEEE